MRRLRGSVSLALSAMLLCLNVEAASLHVHGRRPGGDHGHAPAFHHHDAAAPALPAGVHIEPHDTDRAVVPVVLASCAATPLHDLPAITTRIVTQPADSTSRVTCCQPTARAHGPPPALAASPRAPPRSSRL